MDVDTTGASIETGKQEGLSYGGRHYSALEHWQMHIINKYVYLLIIPERCFFSLQQIKLDLYNSFLLYLQKGALEVFWGIFKTI